MIKMAANSDRTLPTDGEQILMVARYDTLKHLRSRRLLGMIVIEVVMLVLMLALPPLLGQPYSDDPALFVQGVIAVFTYILIVLVATLFAGDAIVSEYQNRTGYLLFPNPIKRTSIYLGKFLSMAAISVLIITIWYGVAIMAGLAVTGGVSGLAVQSYGLALLLALAAGSVGFLISAFMKGATGALILTFILLFMIMPALDGTLGEIGGIRTEPSLSFQSGVINYVLTTPYPVDSSDSIPIAPGQNFTVYSLFPHVDTAVAVMSGYILICNAVAIWRFGRREMVG